MDAIFKKELTNELVKAYKHFGDEDDLVNEVAFVIVDMIECGEYDEDAIAVGEETLTGALVDIAVTKTKDEIVMRDNVSYVYNKMTVVNLLVNDKLTYIEQQYDRYINCNDEEDVEYGDPEYKLTELNKHKGDFCTLWPI